MENQLQIFSNPDFGDIRAIDLDGKPLFVGRDIAIALGYSNPTKALQDHVPDKFKRIINAKDLQQMASESKSNDSLVLEFDSPRGLTFITEAGVYKLIFRSKLPNAEKFSDWVCDEVLPSIRKTGSYSVADTIRAAYDTVITDFERGKELAKLAQSARDPFMKKTLVAKAANLIAGESVFDLDDIGGTKELDTVDIDGDTFKPASISVDSAELYPSLRFAFTLGKWKHKK